MKSVDFKWQLFFISSMLLIFVSCKDISDVKESQFYNFEKSGMGENVEYLFNPFEGNFDNNIQNKYDIIIEVRYSDKCRLKSLPLNVELSSLKNDSIHQRKISIPLFDDKDNFQGKGHFGVFESNFELLKSHVIEEGLNICVSTPEVDSSGILALGVVVKNRN